ncbi:M20/M25/M40 family metallo-hydrolase [Oscillospiraceae bacterium OttesenSCG-928-F05]|nr:M20/M25/M40 family metallo-hydrolase [Oscillospiraceae bacterium OttesenSCG-928-F05]
MFSAAATGGEKTPFPAAVRQTLNDMEAVMHIALIALLIVLLGILLVCAVRARMLRRPGRRYPTPDPVDGETAKHAADSLSAVIKFKTINHGDPAKRDASAFRSLSAYLQARYPLFHRAAEMERVAEFSLVYHLKGRTAKDPFLFCAHQDVVPAEGNWEHGPFSGEIAEERVWGRGALDCKSTLVCLLEAAENMLKEGRTPPRDIYFAFGHDEESGGQEGAASIVRYFAEKRLYFKLVLDEGPRIYQDFIQVPKPQALIGVSEKGALSVRLSTGSAGGHAATPPRHTALGVLAEAICRVEYRPMPLRMNSVFQAFIRKMAPYLGFSDRMMIANPFFFKRFLYKKFAKDPILSAQMRTTIAATMASAGTAPNVLPGRAEATLNIRPVHGDTCAGVLEHLGDLTNGLGVSVEKLQGEEAAAVSDHTGTVYRLLSAVIHASFGDVIVAPYIMPGGTDGRKYEGLAENVFRFCPVLGTKDEFSRVHAVNESIRTESLGSAVRFYETLFLSGDMLEEETPPREAE